MLSLRKPTGDGDTPGMVVLMGADVRLLPGPEQVPQKPQQAQTLQQPQEQLGLVVPQAARVEGLASHKGSAQQHHVQPQQAGEQTPPTRHQAQVLVLQVLVLQILKLHVLFTQVLELQILMFHVLVFQILMFHVLELHVIV